MIRNLLVVALLAPAAAVAQGAAPATPPAPPPEIFLRSPINGATVPSTFSVVFGLRNYGVAPVGVNLSNTGHFHVLINVDAPPVGAVIPADSLNRHFGTGAIETRLTLAPGTYTLRVVLGDFEHKVIRKELVSRPVKITVRP